MSSDLKPCPFCGSDDLRRSELGFRHHWVECKTCHASLDADAGEGHEGVANKWNRRHAAVHPEARADSATDHPKAEGESILREALARLPSLASILRAAGFHPSHGDWWSNEDIDNDDSMISAAAFDRISEAMEAARSALTGMPGNGAQ
jgi:Lar family restriction alleviation protein